MFFKTKNSKKIIVCVALLVLTLALLSPFHAKAGFIIGGPTVPPKSTGSSVGSGISGLVLATAVFAFGAVGVVLQEIAALFLRLMGAVYDSAITTSLNFNQFAGLIIIGWKISRDIANMFFIFILLFIAFTTMLRISGYETKVLLRKFIVIALLINFSLAIGLIIIDATNVLGNEFYVAALGCPPATQPCNHNLSVKIIEGAHLQLLYNFKDLKSGSVLWDVGAQVLGGSRLFDRAVAFAKVTWMGVMLLSLFAYIILFASVLLVIRFAVLAILLVLMPLAFLSYILPKTEEVWHKWWEAFLSHAFFFPAHMFLILFTVVFTNRFVLLFVGQQNQASTDTNLLNVQQPSLMLGYFISATMLVLALIIAKKMSTYGSGLVISWAKIGGEWTRGGALNQSAGRLGEYIQKRSPQSYTAERVGSTLMGLGKKSPFGSREQQLERKADFELKALKKQSAQSQMDALMESKNMKKSQSLTENIIDDDKVLASITKKDDRAELAELRRVLELNKDEKRLKKLDKATQKNTINKESNAGTLAAWFKGLQTDEARQKAMENMNRDHLISLLNKTEDADLNKKFWDATSKMEFEEKEKVLGALKSAPNEAASAALKDADERIQFAKLEDKGAAEVNRNNAIRNMSGGQQVHVWEQKLASGPEGTKAAEEFSNQISNISAEESSKFGRALNAQMHATPVVKLGEKWTKLPKQLKTALMSGMKADRRQALISNAPNENTRNEMIADKVSAGIKDREDKSIGKRVANAAADNATKTKIIIEEHFSNPEGPRETIKFDEQGKKIT